VAFVLISNGGGWFFELLLVPAKLRLDGVLLRQQLLLGDRL